MLPGTFYVNDPRKPPPAELLDYVTHTTCPIVHAADDISVMETLEALPYVINSAKASGAIDYQRINGSKGGAKVSVVGVGMRTHTGVARRMFGALAEHGINISMINTSEVRVSVVVDRDRGEEALAALKGAFALS